MNEAPRGSWKKYLKRRWQDYQWTAIALLGLFALLLGLAGFYRYFASISEPASFGELLYRTLQLFTMEFDIHASGLPWELDVARFLAPAVLVYTAAKAILAIFHEQLQLFRVRFANDHVVICGLGQKGLLLARAFRAKDYPVVCIEQDGRHPGIEQCRGRGAIVLTGNAADSGMLRRARVDRASCLLAVCDDDGTNSDIAVHTRKLVRGKTDRVLNCFIHIADPELVSLLREKELETQKADAIRLNFFNIHDSGARVLLQAWPFLATGPEKTSLPAHILLVGLGPLGESLMLRAAWLWRFRQPAGDAKLRITVVDERAGDKTGRLTARYPQLEQVCEIRVEDVSIHSMEFQRADFISNADGCAGITGIYICPGKDADAMSAALSLRHHTLVQKLPLVVCMSRDAGLAALIEGRGDVGRTGSNLHAFGLLDRTCQADLLLGGTHELLARAIHAAYVEKERRQGRTEKDNASMTPWDDLPETLRNSSRRQADDIGVKLKTAGCDIKPLSDWNAPLFRFSDNDVERLAEMEHARWNRERFRDGWIYAAGEKNVENKTSPWLVDWAELPEEIREYDRNTVRELPAFLARAGFEVYYLNPDRKARNLS
ncbi:MAG: RyR domain-containing protein [Thiogranum sp.]